LLGTAAEFTDAADIRDAMDYSKKTVDAVRQGDWWGAAGAAPWMLAASGAAMMPGVSLGAADEVADGVKKGIRAYHGSPHDFDRFDMSKIGTGEGAQAYGHGLYFADSEGVARSYRDTLSNRDPSGYAKAHLNAQNLVNKVGGDAEYAAQVLRGQLEQGGDEFTTQKLKDTLDFITSGKYAEPLPPAGRMYEVEINADPDTFLDWDKPLSEQPEAVRKAVARDAGPEFDKAADEYSTAYNAYMSRPENPTPEETAALEKAVQDSYQRMIELRGNGNLTGAGVYHELAKGQPWALGSEELRKAGIPGIKYLDAGSRAAGDGSRNYVVFDARLISIVRKYGIAGASAILGYNVLSGMDPAQAAELQQMAGSEGSGW
jgi:hypothetical protein